MIISACSDEISTDLATALDVLASENIEHVDLRGVWGKNVTDLSDEQAAEAQRLLKARGFTVTALSTPVGKTQITADFAPEIERFQRALALAQRLEAPYLRVFSFYATEAEAREYQSEALSRLRKLCELAQPYGIMLAHENEEGGFCAWRPEECLLFHQQLPVNFRTLFEPCSFTVVGYDPTTDALPLLRDFIAYVHVRDTKRGTTQYSVAGEGDVRWRDILADLKAHHFTGYLTLEPHLGWENYGQMTDEIRTANFRRAVQALRAVLATI
ncbi:MAG: sugar phosphate isomerase/epimerase [Chloroflexota bacterium]|nr:sugar phosphate isomerase/epimerase [Chloroflexota bacterium]